MSVKKKSKILKFTSPTKPKTSKRQKGDSPNEALTREFLQEFMRPSFVGLWCFGNQRDFDIWMDVHHNYLLSRGGVYNSATKYFRFPWGATLILKVLNNLTDLQTLKGVLFTYVSVSGKINPDIQGAVLDFLWTLSKK